MQRYFAEANANVTLQTSRQTARQCDLQEHVAKELSSMQISIVVSFKFKRLVPQASASRRKYHSQKRNPIKVPHRHRANLCAAI